MADYLQKFSIFNKGKTFTYSNILRTANDFRRIQNVEVSYDNSRAVESFVNYYYSYYIAFFFVLIIVYDLFKKMGCGRLHSVPETEETI